MSSRISTHRGYLLIDHTNSPGVPEAMLHAFPRRVLGGVGPGGKLEADTWTCSHCQGQVIASAARIRPREVCFRCMQVVCDRCKAIAELEGCQPFKKLIDNLRPDLQLLLPAPR